MQWIKNLIGSSEETLEPGSTNGGSPQSDNTYDKTWRREMQAHYKKLCHSNNIDELREWVRENYYDAVMYQAVLEELGEMVTYYGSAEQERKAQQSEFPANAMLNIICDILEKSPNVKEKLQEELEDWEKSEQEPEKQLLRTEDDEKSKVERSDVKLVVLRQVVDQVVLGMNDCTRRTERLEDEVAELKRDTREVHLMRRRLEELENYIKDLIRKRDQVADESAEPSTILPAFQSPLKTSNTPSKESRIPVSKFPKGFKTPQSQVVPRSTIQPIAEKAGPSGIAMPGSSGIVMPGPSDVAMPGPSDVAMPGPSGKAMYHVRSPVTSLAPPLPVSDRSVSCDKKYGNDYASSPSSSPVIKKPTHGYLSPDFLLSSSSSKDPDSDLFLSSSEIKRQRCRYQSLDSDRNSLSPVIQSSDYRYLSTPGRTYRSDSPDSERGYFYKKGSLNSSHLNEAGSLYMSPRNEARFINSSHLNGAHFLD